MEAKTIDIFAVFGLMEAATGVAHILSVLCDEAEADDDAAMAGTYAVLADALTSALESLEGGDGADEP